jgi:hypothetical protein
MVVTHGLTPNIVEFILEPDAGANIGNWTAAKIANNMVQTESRLAAAGYTGVKFAVPSTTNGANANTWYNDIQTANGSALGLIDYVFYHLYDGGMTSGQKNTLRDNAESDGNCAAMTEWIAATYLNWFSDMVHGRSCIWQQYAIAFDEVGFSDTKYFDISSPTVTPTTYTKYLRHGFKYVMRGAVMKDVTNSHASCEGVAFVNPNGTYVVVLKATGSVTCTVADLPPGTYGRKRTQGNGTSSPSSYDTDLGNATVSTTEDVSFTFTGEGVGTVYDTNYLQFADPVKTKIKGAKIRGAKF